MGVNDNKIPTLDERWRDLEQAIVLAIEDENQEEPYEAEPILQAMRDLIVAERFAVAVREQTKAIEWIARELGGEYGKVVLRLGELVARGDVKL